MTATTDRLAQILERLGALAQQPAQPLLSVEVSQSARGATQVTIKAYAASADEAAVAAQRV